MNQKAVKRINEIGLLGYVLLFNMVWIAGADEAALKNPDGSWKWTNRLVHETSPYLLLHAHNPVDWYPWGDEALERGKERKQVDFSFCRLLHVLLVPRHGAESLLKPRNRRDDE